MDFYVILGLEPGASPAEIKRAYRRLSRRYHPGVNPGDRQAEAMFERVTEAYEMLSDPERRRQYDAAGSSTARGRRRVRSSLRVSIFRLRRGGRTPRRSASSSPTCCIRRHTTTETAETGADLHAALTVSFEESFRGVERQVLVTRQVLCAACAGGGRIRTPEGRCAHCKRRGRYGGPADTWCSRKSCAACGGTGRHRFQRCEVCSAHGRLVRSEPVMVDVPPGVVERRAAADSRTRPRRPPRWTQRRSLRRRSRRAAPAVAPRRGSSLHRRTGGGSRSGARRAHRCADAGRSV